jgi:rhodanese-related sulfurtransferase
MGLFSNLFGGGGPSAADLLGKGAVVVDVRTPAEYGGGHVKGSVNIPLDQIERSVDRIRKMGKPVVLCCASGMRSGRATSFLKQQGIECANGGPWTSVR